MYEIVKKILDTSREKGVDVLVAKDMVINDGESYEVVTDAYKSIISKYYDVVTFFRRNDDNASIEKICKLHDEGKTFELQVFIKEVRDANEL